MDDKIKYQLVTTRGIKNCRDSKLIKGCSPLQFLCNLTGNRPQSATFHTANVGGNFKKDKQTENLHNKKMLKLFRKNRPKKDLSIYERLVGFDAYYKYDPNQNLISFFEEVITNLPSFGFKITSVIDEDSESYEKYCQNINLGNLKNGLIIKDDSSPEAVFYFPQKNNIISICLWFEFEPERLKKIEDKLVKNVNLIYATVYSQYDNKWQNEEQILVYEINKKSLKTKEFTKDIFNKKCIDISYNYGRTVKYGEIGYIAGWKMWFGEKFPLISRTQLNSMTALRNKQIDFNILEIQLFDKLIVDDYESNRDMQKEFIELINKNYRQQCIYKIGV